MIARFFSKVLANKALVAAVAGVAGVAVLGGVVLALSGGESGEDNSPAAARVSSTPKKSAVGEDGSANDSSPSSSGSPGTRGPSPAVAGNTTRPSNASSAPTQVVINPTIAVAAVTPTPYVAPVQPTLRPVVIPTLPPVVLPTLPPVVQPTPLPYTIVRDTCIDGTFTGWTGDTLFELCNGELWLQASYDYTYHYAYRPDAQIVLYLGSYYLFVEGVDDLVAVTQVTDYISSCISSDFDGWDGDTVFELCNGQVWQQAEYDYTYHYAYRPDVIIYWSGYQYLMKVDGIDDALAVSQVY